MEEGCQSTRQWDGVQVVLPSSDDGADPSRAVYSRYKDTK